MSLAGPRRAALWRLEALSRADWLTGARARAWGWLLLAVTALIALGWVAASRGGLDPTGKPLGTDFTSFWSASKLALSGVPALAYDVSAHHAQQTALFERDNGYAAFFYPPIFLLICLPLAQLPYLASLAAWLTATGALYWRMARGWLGEAFGVMPIFAFPAVLTNIGHGQNGFLSAALFGAGGLWLERRPILAGLCLGALAYKPHLGIMIPIALAIAGRWRTFAAAGAAVLALSAASYGLFGPETWRGFLADSAMARSALERGLVGDGKMQSAFAAVRLWGGGVGLAYGVQAAVAATAAAALLWLQRRVPNSGAEGPAMIVAALLASPFLLDYDLVVLAAPLAWMVREGAAKGFLSWEKLALLAAFVLPAVARTLATEARLPVAPAVMAGLLVAILRRAAFASGQQDHPGRSGASRADPEPQAP
jgi:alpha-1,2-mannosyltransferase